MKTIEVNLIGDLKQKTTSKKLGSIPTSLTADEKPQDAKNNMILYGVSGSGILVGILLVIIFLVLFGFGIYLDVQVSNAENTITEKNAELAIYKKKQTSLSNEKKDLLVKDKIKKYFVEQKFPMGDVLEELRAKIPTDIYLTEVKKAKGGFLLKGNVSSTSNEPLKSITRFIININTMMPEASIIEDAFLASVSTNEGIYTFAIKANLKGIVDPKQKKL